MSDASTSAADPAPGHADSDGPAPAATLVLDGAQETPVPTDPPTEEQAPHGRCQVCRTPLPEPVRRSDGRYKGGRRRMYCPPPKDCKERAQALREARVAEAVGDPLRMVAA